MKQKYLLGLWVLAFCSLICWCCNYDFRDTKPPEQPSLPVAWQKAAGYAEWEGRDRFGLLAFKDKLWVLGGHNSSGELNDVWSSADGIRWEKVTTYGAGWKPRRALACVVFKNKMWVLGGVSGTDTCYNDVWSSEDGLNWQRVKDNSTSPLTWNPRRAHSCVVFKTKEGNEAIWLIGGYDNTEYKNEVWYSTDGVNWTQATNNAFQGGGRYYHSCLVYQDKLWVIGGSNNTTNSTSALKDVYCSADGEVWECVTDSLVCGRSGHNSLLFNNKMWIIGGNDIAFGKTNISYSSEDGKNWQVAQLGAYCWAGRMNQQSIVFKGKVWVIGGSDTNGIFRNDVWYSQDMQNWQSTHPDWGQGIPSCITTFNDKLWALGIHDGISDKNSIWSSADGLYWKCEADSAAWIAPRYGQRCVSYNNRLWLTGGFDATAATSPSKNDVYSSPDGINWTKAAVTSGFTPRFYHGFAVYKDLMWIAGGYNGDGSSFYNNLYTSTDGKAWTPVLPQSSLWSGRYGHAFFEYKGKLWVIGGCNGSGLLNDIWATEDGANWTEITPSAPWAPRAWFGIAVYGDRIWLAGGGNGDGSIHYGDTWYSEDGQNWHQYTPGNWAERLTYCAVFKNRLFLIGGRTSSVPGNYLYDVWYLE